MTADPIKSPRLRTQNFGVYYGYGPLRGLDTFDLLILESDGWRQRDLDALKGRGGRLLGYLSALELPRHLQAQSGLSSTDLLHIQGAPWYKKEFDALVANPTSPAWQNHLARRLEVLRARGFDGIFLDTLGDVEDPLVAHETGWLVPAAAWLVRYVRNLWPQQVLVVNNGIWLLLPLISSHIDGICWETDVLDVSLDEPWTQLGLSQVSQSATREGLATFLLSHVPDGPGASAKLETLERYAERYGLVCYGAPGDYHTAIRTPNREVIAGRTHFD